MKIFTLKKNKGHSTRLKFSKEYFARLMKIHPYAAQLIYCLLKKVNTKSGIEVFLDNEQNILLEDKIKAVKTNNWTQAQVLLEQTYSKSVLDNCNLRVDLEKTPELVDEVYQIIEKNT
jgi:hypothetical protein